VAGGDRTSRAIFRRLTNGSGVVDLKCGVLRGALQLGGRIPSEKKLNAPPRMDSQEGTSMPTRRLTGIWGRRTGRKVLHSIHGHRVQEAATRDEDRMDTRYSRRQPSMVMVGSDLQTGIGGFGDTVAAALRDLADGMEAQKFRVCPIERSVDCDNDGNPSTLFI
jgi:hypothetical protein